MLLVLLIAFTGLCLCADTTPQQVHIALAGNDGKGNSNKVAISWQTVDSTSHSYVKYGVKSSVYTSTVEGKSSSYFATYDHHCITDELTPNTKYYYIVGSDETGWSSEKSFTSPPLSADLRENFSFMFYADLGVVNGDYSINYLAKTVDSYDLIFHGGDISYADDSFTHVGCFTEFCYEDVYNKYMNMIEPFASSKYYMTAPGNHEADCHDANCMLSKEKREKLSNFTAYNSRFLMPSTQPNAYNMHYSFNYGNAHFIAIDTETGYSGAPLETKYIFPCGGFAEQLTWLEQDLIDANKNRAERPWIFVSGHRPIYFGDSVNLEVQNAFEELFYKYKVDMYFAGHVHHYERDYPTYRNVSETSYNNPRATSYVQVGGPGNDEMNNVSATIKVDKTLDTITPKDKYASSSMSGPWTAMYDAENRVGVSKVTIIDDNNLKFEYIRTSTGEVYDTINLYRDHSSMT